MIRVAGPIILCGLVFAAAPARAQNETTDRPPANALPAESPSAPLVSPEATPAEENKAVQIPAPENRPPEGAIADSRPPESMEGRYTFSRVQDGYVRLDNRTGQVSFCSKRTVGWTCQLAPEDRGVFENEIARLQEENASLKKNLLQRGLPLPGGVKTDPSVAKNDRPFALPSDPNFDRMKDFVGEVWRRLVALIVSLQKDVLKKS